MSEQIIMKTCIKCKLSKPINDFRPRKDSKDGHRNDCRVCENKRHTDRYHTEEGKILHMRRIKKYRNTEKGKNVADKALKKYRNTLKGILQSRRASRIYQQDHKEQIAPQKKQWEQSPAGKTSQKEWEKKNPEQRKAQIALTNAIGSGKIKPAKMFNCTYCSKKAEQYHHHLGYAPEHWFDVIPLCRDCHTATHRYFRLQETIKRFA